MEMYECLLKFQTFVPKGPMNNIPALFQIMAGLAPSRWQTIIWTIDG